LPITAPPPPPPQYLPVEARWCVPQGCFELEVPRTQAQQQRGLMQRPALGPWQGMWFRYDPPAQVGVWMHQCIAPLDLVFLRQGRIAAISADVPPCPRLPCPVVYSPGNIDGFLELRAGRARELGLRVGDPAAPALDSAAPAASPRPGARRD
jgi:hypothetical protein